MMVNKSGLPALSRQYFFKTKKTDNSSIVVPRETCCECYAITRQNLHYTASSENRCSVGCPTQAPTRYQEQILRTALGNDDCDMNVQQSYFKVSGFL